MATKIKKFLSFHEDGTIPGGTTLFVRVMTADGRGLLGTIRWFAAWRRYTFYPFSDTLFDAGCLREVADYLEKMMQDHAKKKK